MEALSPVAATLLEVAARAQRQIWKMPLSLIVRKAITSRPRFTYDSATEVMNGMIEAATAIDSTENSEKCARIERAIEHLQEALRLAQEAL